MQARQKGNLLVKSALALPHAIAKAEMETRTGPIRSIRLINFRRFRDTGPIELSPITLFLGKNSSGKTSLLRSLLLARQMITEASFEEVPLAGPLVDFGSYRELVYEGEMTRDVELHIEFDISKVSNDWPKSAFAGPFKRLQTRMMLEMVLHWNKKAGKPQFKRIALLDPESHLGFAFVRTGPAAFRATSPSGSQIVRTPLTFANLRRVAMDNVITPSGTDTQRPVVDFTLFALLTAVGEVLNEFQHVGPLRDMPSRAYRVDQLTPLSPTANVVNALERHKQVRLSLSRALQQMGMAEDISLTRIAPGYVGITLTDPGSGRARNLSDVGFGVSQVLPVLSQILTGQSGSTVYIEQPELHLHPEAQGSLADVLFSASAQRGSTLLAETHSEHILLRLLRRIAEESVPNSDASVVIVDDGVVTQLRVDRFGALVDGALPEGFFEEDWEDTLALAKAASSRKAE